MSVDIEQKVVEMRFDNKQFESETSKTMSTIEKLKEKLNFKNSSKSFDELDESAKKLDLSGIGNGLETVKAKFSALGVMGVTALANITNSAVNAGKRIVSALTIDPIKTGFQEYETQINSVQTILANTESKGSTLQDVNAALAELNTYADKTIYNFTEMTRNIGTFTAAGVDLKTATSSIQGIANMAAISGSTSQQASTAMYQLSQAMAAGTVKLQDWNSVVNAGMGGQVFQDALKQTARHVNDTAAEVRKMGKAEQDAFQKARGYTDDQMERFKSYNFDVDALIKKEGSFRESLAKGWITAEVLTETLQRTTKTGAAEYLSDLTGIEYDQIKSAQKVAEETGNSEKAYAKLAETMAKTGKISKKEALSTLKMADTAENAATKVKTFTQLWDTLKEAAQSGWTQSWQIMIGDFEEAKGLLTEISDSVGGAIGKFSDYRNNILSKGLSSGWKQFLNEGITNEEDFEKSVKKTAKEHGVAINDMIEKSGSLKASLKEGWMSPEILSESVDKMVDKLSKLSSEELKLEGYTKDDVSKLKELQKGLKDGSLSAEEFAKKMSQNSGRENIIEGFRNAFKGLLTVIGPIKEAFKEIFPTTGDERAKGLYALTEKFKEFTSKLKLTEERAEKVKRAFKGLFAIFDIGKKIISSLFAPIINLAGSKGIQNVADFILDIAASIGDFFTSLNEGFKTDGFKGALTKVTDGISKILETVTGKLGGFGSVMSKIANWVSDTAVKIWDVIQKVFGWITDNVSAGDIFKGLLGGGILVTIKKIIDIFTKAGDAIDKVKEAILGLFGKGNEEASEGIKDKFKNILDSVKESLNSFTTGIKIASLVFISLAIGILVNSLKTLSELKIDDIVTGLGAIGVLFKYLTASFKSFTKSLTRLTETESKGIIKSAIAMVLMAVAIKILAGAMAKIGALPLEEIGKGLLGIGGGLAELCLAVNAIGKVEVPIKTSISVVALAFACKLLGDAMQKFAGLSWDEIGRGLVAMAGALGEVVGVIAILGKVGGGSSLLGALSIVIIIPFLNILANALKKFGDMQWDEIGRGLVAMGGALAEIAIVTGALGYLAGFGAIVGSIALDMIIPFLNILADALKKFGDMQWDEIGRGLVAMGGALTEIAVVTGALGYLAGFGAIVGSIALDMIIPFLDTLANALKKFGDMTWDEIGRGLVAMGGALAEIAVVTGALGYLTGLGGLIGSISLGVIIPFLDELAAALKKFGAMMWDEIGRGLTAMGGALAEIAVVTGALGYLTGLGGLIGSISLGEIIPFLDELATALKKFGEMQWDEIGRGLTAMGAALGELAVGGILNSLSGLGASSVSKIVGPLNQLADAIKKFGELDIETTKNALETMKTALGKTALGGLLNTFSGAGASSIAKVAGPLGTLADSIKKWTNITVPDNLGENLTSISTAVNNFLFGGIGSGSMKNVAEPLGALADSVRKWEGVTVSATLGDDLEKLSTGVKAWTWAFVGGMSIDSAIDPLSKLPDAIAKWKGVKLPENMEESLTSLSNGVKSWNWAFLGGISIDSAIDPLSKLPEAIAKWKDVKLPENMEGSLTSLSNGVKSWTWAFTEAGGMESVSGPLGDFAEALKKWKKVKVPDETTLSSFADNVKTFVEKIKLIKYIDSDTISSFSDSVAKLNEAINSITPNSSSAIDSFIDSIEKLGSIDVKGDSLKKTATSISSAVKSMMKTLNYTIESNESSVASSMSKMLDGMINSIKSKTGPIKNATSSLISALNKGVTSSSSSVNSSFSSLIAGGVNAIRSKYSSMQLAGSYLGAGLVNGIKSKEEEVYKAGYNLGVKAVQGEKDGQDSASPSKETIKAGKWFGEGLVIGINKMGKAVYKAGYGLGDEAVNSLSSTISGIGDTLNSEVDMNPTIRPVLDLSSIRSGASSIGGMLNGGSLSAAISSTDSINFTMNRNQNRSNNEIIKAVDGLKDSLNNTSGSTYNINGITYDDGSNVSSAVETLVRAARIERRA